MSNEKQPSMTENGCSIVSVAIDSHRHLVLEMVIKEKM
jgi:hypothetical protein